MKRNKYKSYPKLEEVKGMPHVDVAGYYRFLPSPENQEQTDIIDAIVEKLDDLGGITPEVSKRIGW